jgi:hypothetical protein
MKKEKLTELQNELNECKVRCQSGNRLACIWVGVIYPKKKWREAKKLGLKKDSYWGWIAWSGSTNSNGDELLDKANTLVQNNDLRVVSRWL